MSDFLTQVRARPEVKQVIDTLADRALPRGDEYDAALVRATLERAAEEILKTANPRQVAVMRNTILETANFLRQLAEEVSRAQA